MEINSNYYRRPRFRVANGLDSEILKIAPKKFHIYIDGVSKSTNVEAVDNYLKSKCPNKEFQCYNLNYKGESASFRISTSKVELDELLKLQNWSTGIRLKKYRACITSDLSIAEESDIPKRRIIRKPQLYSPPNSSDSDDSKFGGLKDIPKMPNGANKPVQKNQSLRPQFKSIPDSRGTNTGCSQKSQSFQIEDCQTSAEEKLNNERTFILIVQINSSFGILDLSNAGTYDSTVTNVMIDVLSEQLKQVSVSCEAQPSVDTEKWELLPLQNMEQFNAFEDKLHTMKVTNESISIKDIEIQIGLWLTTSTERLKKKQEPKSHSVVN
ncbi:hypothetical protein FQR65_LT04346 [Abscondita terminalis]|nr:hypothetical protein FQR65_LT04346 [Abscondita terminalis]